MATKTSFKGIAGVAQAENNFRFLGDAVAVGFVNKNFTKQMADLIIKNIQINYQAFLSTIGDDKQKRDKVLNAYAIREDSGYEIRIVGEQVIYDEFGTGDKGAAHPHPKKGNYHLNDYNSGKYIRRSSHRIENGKYKRPRIKGQYWTFISPVDWKLTYSQGVPSGQFIYRGLEDTSRQLKELADVFNNELKNAAKGNSSGGDGIIGATSYKDDSKWIINFDAYMDNK